MDARWLLGLVCALFAPTAGLADPDPGQAVLTDDDLVAYAALPYNKVQMTGRWIDLGRHHDVPVVVEFPCGDVCPDYTVRIIHYAVPPGAPCDAIGGVTQTWRLPVGIAMGEQAYCIPEPLAKPASGGR